MNPAEDRTWEEVVDRLDMLVSDAELAQAEADLQATEPEPLPPGLIDAVVARAQSVSGPRVTLLQPPRRHLWRWVSMGSAAAVLIAMLLLQTAATKNKSKWLGHDANENLPFALAVQILREDDSIKADLQSSLGIVMPRVASVIRQLRAIAEAPEAPPVLVAAAKAGLDNLSGPCVAAPLETLPESDPRAALRRSRAQEGTLEQRLADIRTMTALAVHGTHAIREIGSPGIEQEQEVCLRNLRRLLDGKRR